MNEKKKKVAVFDIDGTIFRSSLLYELTEALIEKRVISRYARSYYREAWEKWQVRAEDGDYDKFIMGVVEAYHRYIKGVRRSDVWRVAEEIIEKQKRRTYRWTRDLVAKLKEDHFMLAISHSPYEMVAPFAQSLGFDKVYATVYEVDKKVRYTGNILYENIILHKDRAMLRSVEKENLTLRGSIGVGDSESDIQFLKLVSHPIAFNPSSGLYRTARRASWQIIVERKDVIYKL